jgi:hypothetical protein
MGRALDEFVIASQLRIDEVVTFVREVEAQAAAQLLCPAGPDQVEPTDAVPTRRDLKLPVRMWARGLVSGGGRARQAVVATALLIAAGLTIGLGAGARHRQAEACCAGQAQETHQEAALGAGSLAGPP